MTRILKVCAGSVARQQRLQNKGKSKGQGRRGRKAEVTCECKVQCICMPASRALSCPTVQLLLTSLQTHTHTS